MEDRRWKCEMGIDKEGSTNWGPIRGFEGANP